jgi:hypothetical protein
VDGCKSVCMTAAYRITHVELTDFIDRTVFIYLVKLFVCLV